MLAGRDREARELARNLAVVGIDEEDLDRWVKDARVDTLVSAFDSGSITQINAAMRALRNQGVSDESIASSMSSRYRETYVGYVRSGQMSKARRLAERLQALGLMTPKSGENKVRQEILDGWVEAANKK